jgi:hypothetical protein
MFNTNNILISFDRANELKLNERQSYILFLFYEFINNDNEEARIVINKLINTFNKAVNTGILTEEEQSKKIIPLNEEDRLHLIKQGLFKKLENKSNGKISVILNNELCGKLFTNMSTAYDELLDTFKNVIIQYENGSAIVNNVDDRIKYEKVYYDSINGSYDTHRTILNICKQAIKKGLVNCGLVKIINNKLWETWKLQLTANNDINNTNSNMEII